MFDHRSLGIKHLGINLTLARFLLLQLFQVLLLPQTPNNSINPLQILFDPIGSTTKSRPQRPHLNLLINYSLFQLVQGSLFVSNGIPLLELAFLVQAKLAYREGLFLLLDFLELFFVGAQF